MAVHSLIPAWIRLDYHSVYGSHVQLIGTRDWIPTSITGVLGSYSPWAGSPIDAEAMIDALVAKLADLHLPTTSFDLVTIYTQAAIGAPIFPRATKTLTVAGTAGAVGAAKAIQSNLNARSALGAPVKLVLLDASALNVQMDKILPISFPPAVNALVTEWTAPGNAWSSRDDSKPSTALSWTMTENNELRKRYRKG